VFECILLTSDSMHADIIVHRETKSSAHDVT